MYRIAFFGNDIFSLASFKAVVELYRQQPRLISDLSLITRKLKPSGRGMKNVVEPDIVKFARSSEIQWMEIEEKQEFEQLISRKNLALAVSYGKLIPHTLISSLRYGGLNVHPSLLPQYRGATPIQQAIMDQRDTTGVSVQTLHPYKFDHGNLLWQSTRVKIGERDTTQSLMPKLGKIGAQGLLDVLQNVDLTSPRIIESTEKPSLATLPSKSLHRIDFNLTAKELDARGRALGKLWFEQHSQQKQPKRGKPKGHPVLRVNLEHFEAPETSSLPIGSEVGEISEAKTVDGKTILAVKCKEGWLGSSRVTVQGLKPESAQEYFENLQKRKLGKLIVHI